MASVSDSWRRQLVRYADGKPVYVPLHGKYESVDTWVLEFRRCVIPLVYVADVLRRDQRTIRRMVAEEQIPGWFKTKGGHYRLRHCPEFWDWLMSQEYARERADTWSQAALWRELHTPVEIMLAFQDVREQQKHFPDKKFTTQDFDDAMDRAFHLSQERYGVLFEKLPRERIKQARNRTTPEWYIGFEVLKWHLTDTMPKTGDEAGRRMWGDDSWDNYQVSRRREFVTVFRKWKKTTQDDSWLREKIDVRNRFGAEISAQAWLGERVDDEDE